MASGTGGDERGLRGDERFATARLQRPASAEEILHPPQRTRIADAAYLVGIGLLALAVGAGALWLSEESGMGVATQESVPKAPADVAPEHQEMPGRQPVLCFFMARASGSLYVSCPRGSERAGKATAAPGPAPSTENES